MAIPKFHDYDFSLTMHSSIVLANPAPEPQTDSFGFGPITGTLVLENPPSATFGWGEPIFTPGSDVPNEGVWTTGSSFGP